MPINFTAVRMAESLIHPRVLSQTGGNLPGDMRLTFLVCLVAMTLLFVTLWKLELTSKHASMQLEAPAAPARGHRGLIPVPALPLDEAGKYVAAAYLVFLTLLIVYVAIIGHEGGAHGAGDR